MKNFGNINRRSIYVTIFKADIAIIFKFTFQVSYDQPAIRRSGE